jgi:hypothetical protein
VKFLNDESRMVEHNVFSNAPAKRFDLGLFGPGENRMVTFDKPGPVFLYCSIHKFMDGVVVRVPDAAVQHGDVRRRVSHRRHSAGQVHAAHVAAPTAFPEQDDPITVDGTQTQTQTQTVDLELKRKMRIAVRAISTLAILCAGCARPAAPPPAADPRDAGGEGARRAQGPAPASGSARITRRRHRRVTATRSSHRSITRTYPASWCGSSRWRASRRKRRRRARSSWSSSLCRPPPAPVHAAAVGSVVTLHNRGGKSAPIYSVSDGNEFELGPLMPGGEGAVRLQIGGAHRSATPESCNRSRGFTSRPPAPWRGTAGAGERVMFESIAPGNYRIATWHERLPGSEFHR